MTEKGNPSVDFKGLENRIKRNDDYVHLDRISRDFTEEVLHALEAAAKQQNKVDPIVNTVNG